MRTALVVVAVVALAGCGAAKLSSDEKWKVGNVELAFSETVVSGDSYGKTLRGVDYLIALCRRNPDAHYKVGGDDRTMRQVVEDGANTLREYQPDLAAKLQTVADNGCE